jgi:hypothetical protein
MSKTQKKWLRLSVMIGLGCATFTTLAVVTVYGAVAPSNYVGGVSSAANCTVWNAVSLFGGGASIVEMLVPVIMVALVVIGVLLVCLVKGAFLGGMAE